MVLVNMSYQEDPIAVIFVVVVGRGEAYEVDFYKESSKRDSSKNKKSTDHETA